MDITAKMVKELREKTSAGMMDCKNALTSTGGDLEKAKDWLRERGLATVGKRAGRVAREGVVATAVAADLSRAAVVELSTETDFVAKTEGFRELARNIVRYLAETPDAPADVSGLLERECPLCKTKFGELLTQNTAKTGEKSEIRRFRVLKADSGGFTHAYNHAGDKLSVLVALSAEKPGDDAVAASHELAMQIAAHNPSAVEIAALDPAELEREKAIYGELVKNSGKPEKVWPKIIEGYLSKYYQQVVLLEQPYIKEPKISVKTYLAGLKAQTGAIKIQGFVRYQLAEELGEGGA
ncbi:MAG: translation elongation factor Ts [Deltaproteobacteria bacterium]|jgi:elongation factor Ts|nr:translation elongation factor Ts [Deltaproteobacteria bacterium]